MNRFLPISFVGVLAACLSAPLQVRSDTFLGSHETSTYVGLGADLRGAHVFDSDEYDGGEGTEDAYGDGFSAEANQQLESPSQPLESPSNEVHVKKAQRKDAKRHHAQIKKSGVANDISTSSLATSASNSVVDSAATSVTADGESLSDTHASADDVQAFSTVSKPQQPQSMELVAHEPVAVATEGTPTDAERPNIADIAAAEAVSSARADGMKSRALDMYASGDSTAISDLGEDEIQEEARQVENEDAEVLAAASGNEVAETDDEELDKSVDSDINGKVSDPPDYSDTEQGRAQLSEATDEDTRVTDDGAYGIDVNGEAKEIESEDAEVESASREDEHAGAELDDMLPNVRSPRRQRKRPHHEFVNANLFAGNAVNTADSALKDATISTNSGTSDVISQTAGLGTTMAGFGSLGTAGLGIAVPQMVQNMSVQRGSQASPSAAIKGSEVDGKRALIQRKHAGTTMDNPGIEIQGEDGYPAEDTNSQAESLPEEEEAEVDGHSIVQDSMLPRLLGNIGESNGMTRMLPDDVMEPLDDAEDDNTSL